MIDNPLDVWLASDQGKRAVAHAEHERQQMKYSELQEHKKQHTSLKEGPWILKAELPQDTPVTEAVEVGGVYTNTWKEVEVNVDTGQMGEMEQVLRDAKEGERVIPATIIGMDDTVHLDAARRNQKRQMSEQEIDTSNARIVRGVARVPKGTYANKKGKAAGRGTTVLLLPTERVRAPVYGPRRPLREVRQEIAAAAAARATNDDGLRSREYTDKQTEREGDDDGMA